MIIIKYPADLSDTYPLDCISPLKDLLFFDIKTTGFFGDISQLYLIGCTYHDGFGQKLIQWFVDPCGSEREPPATFFTFVERSRILVHSNRDGSDTPYLLRYCCRLDLPYNFDRIKSVDICEKTKPYRELLGLENMKQKSIEQSLGLARGDKYNGGQLVEVYREYPTTHESFLYDLLTLYNEDDLEDMPSTLPILSYADMMEAPFSLEFQQLFTYGDMAGNACPFLSLIWKSHCAVPVPLAYDSIPVSLELNRDALVCNTAPYQGELKYFYSNYKGYYYLPPEDMAIHKNTGGYVDRDTRMKVTARTCYIKKQGFFLPQFGVLWSPASMQEYRASFTYAEYGPETLIPDNMADAYVRQTPSYVSQIKEL